MRKVLFLVVFALLKVRKNARGWGEGVWWFLTLRAETRLQLVLFCAS